MKIMDAIKNDIGKLKNVFTPEVVNKAALIGGAALFFLNAAKAANERKAMEEDVTNSVLKKLTDGKLTDLNGES